MESGRTWRPEIYDRLFASKDYATEAALLHALVQSRRPEAASLLDVACGTGRHLKVLASFYRVEGLDLSREMLDAARKKLPGVPLHNADMADFDLGAEFDVVTCLFSAIACLPSTSALDSSVACMAKHLTPGGILVIEPWDEPVEYSPENALWVERIDDNEGSLVCVESTRLEGDRWISEAHYLACSDGRIEHVSEFEQLAALTGADFERAFTAAGLTFEHDDFGLIGRGLHIGQKVAR